MTRAELESPTDLKGSTIPAALRALLADAFALYPKTKNFDWHISGSHLRDYHLILNGQSDQIFAITDDIAERARKIGGTVASGSCMKPLERVRIREREECAPAPR